MNEINVLEWLEESAGKYPDKFAVEDLKHSLTYAQLWKASFTVGAALADKVKPRQGVAVFMDKTVDTLTVFFGAVYAGGFYCMLDPSQPAERLNHILDTLSPAVLVTDEKMSRRLTGLHFTGPVMKVDDLLAHKVSEQEKHALALVRSQALDIDPLYAIFTSGSTGLPKGVLVPHRAVIDFITYFTKIMGITKDDIIGNQAPFDFDVSVKDIYSAICVGATLELIPKMYFSFPSKLLDFLDERKVTNLTWAVSALCIVTTLNGFSYKIPSSIKRVIFSGEVMPIKHLNRWRKAYPNAMFVNVYGPTEITCNCLYYVVDRDFKEDEQLPLGRPFPNERVFLLNEQNEPVTSKTPGVLGEICVSGTSVGLGYLNDAERTKQAFVQNPLNTLYPEVIYRTGDLASFGEDGQLYYRTRKDFQVKLQGHRIELPEVELAADACAGVTRSCCVFDQEHSRLALFYVGTADKKEIVKTLQGKLPHFMIPALIQELPEFPLTKNGKIDRKALLARCDSKQRKE